MKYILPTKTLVNMNLIRASQKDPFISNDVRVRIICTNGKASYLCASLSLENRGFQSAKYSFQTHSKLIATLASLLLKFPVRI